jgi:hypothetical protein
VKIDLEKFGYQRALAARETGITKLIHQESFHPGGGFRSEILSH